MNQKGSVQLILPAVILVVIIAGITTTNITTTKTFPPTQVLGEDEADQKAAEQAKEAAKKAIEQAKEAAQKAAEQSSKVQINTQSEGTKSETEIQTSTGQKIKTKVEDNGATKVEIELGKQKLKISSEKQQSEIELDTEEASEEAQQNLEDLRSISKFPLSINPSTNQLILTKDGTSRVLTILPAKAVQNMLLAHLKTGEGPKFFGEATSSASPSADLQEAEDASGIDIQQDQITLEETDGQVAYKIPAKKTLKVLGFIPITTDIVSFVAADSGTLLKEQESLLSKILSFLSPQ